MIKKKIQNIYKNIVYSIFKIFYGDIKGITKPDKTKGEIVDVVIDQKYRYKLYVCKKARMYTDTIHDTAFIKDNHIIDGPSFQFRNNIMANCNENSIFNKGTPRIKKKINGKVFSLLTGGGGNYNYYHWLFDVLPRLFILKNKINIETIDYFLLPNIELKFQKESLDLLEIPENKRISSQRFRHLSADEILSVDHPYVFLNDPTKDADNIPEWIINFYKNEIKKKVQINKEQKKIFIDRSDSSSNIKDLRVINNENDVKKMLISKGFEIFKLSDLSFSKQIELFHNSKTVIGLHGAGLSNILFCQPDTKIIEIKPSHVGRMYEMLGIKLKLNYINLTSMTQNIKIDQPNQLGDINVDLTKLEKLIN